MPVTIFPRDSTPTSQNTILSGAVFPSGYTTGDWVGKAVGVEWVGGHPRLFLVGAETGDNPQAFMGFLVSDGDSAVLATGRGSLVTPVVMGGGALSPRHPVYLSSTPGEVSVSGASSGSSGFTQMRVGVALSPTLMSLSTDFSFET